MDYLLLALVIAITVFLLRMVFIALGLRSAARSPGSVDRTALLEAKKGLKLHEELRKQALAEPGKQLRAAKSQLAEHRRIKSGIGRT